MRRYVMFAVAPIVLGATLTGVGSKPLHAQEEPSMAKEHESNFEITSWEETDLVEGDVRVYRTDVGKRFSGDIEGTSEAWLVMTIAPSGSAAYVGLEVFDVSIGGRRGTFVLKHDATATNDGQEASWVVISGSGTGELAGIEGTGQIERHEDGSHSFTLNVE